MDSGFGGWDPFFLVSYHFSLLLYHFAKALLDS